MFQSVSDSTSVLFVAVLFMLPLYIPFCDFASIFFLTSQLYLSVPLARVNAASGLMLLWGPHACETPVPHLQAEANSVLLIGWVSWYDAVCHSLVPCCSVPKEEGCVVRSVTVVQTELHFMSAKKLFVSVGNQSSRLVVSWPLLSCVHLSNKNKCRKWKKKNNLFILLCCVSLCLSVFILHYHLFTMHAFSVHTSALSTSVWSLELHFILLAARPWELGGGPYGWISPPAHPEGFGNWAWAIAAPAGDVGLRSEM